MNNGTFLCYNCGIGIHQLHYGVEVSFIKAIEGQEWTHVQLRALINSGNRIVKDYMAGYDLLQGESVQKRYTTVAMQYHRDKLKAKVEGGGGGGGNGGVKPEYEQGRRQANI